MKKKKISEPLPGTILPADWKPEDDISLTVEKAPTLIFGPQINDGIFEIDGGIEGCVNGKKMFTILTEGEISIDPEFSQEDLILMLTRAIQWYMKLYQ